MDVEALMTGKNAMLGGGIFVLASALRQSFKPFFDSDTGERLLPMLPLVLGVLGALLGICENAPTVGDKVVLGLLVGSVVGQGYKLGKTSVMGYGTAKRPKKKKVEPEPTPEPTPEPAPAPEEGKE